MPEQDRRFSYDYLRAHSSSWHAPEEDLCHTFQELADRLEDVLPAGREKSLTMTKLEETFLWAAACLARNRPPEDDA
ncbi:Acb2/Tad1 domain-containing protein [Nocardia otitidiscaviarum]|uniref:Acb2/Tad1 domain-containing protein n=1 Tax=Nocardia otitidiscaviarum TaxID=1823 RepID=UPI0005BA7153|nr:hypothetical protein [Nocardia otitidiscaviarum]